jgi:hypothetical protein
MNRFTKHEITFILLVAVVFLSLSYYVAFNFGMAHGLRSAEDAGELALEAAAQQYKTALENDTSKYDYYGNERFSEKPNRFILPENARTKNADWQTSKTQESTTARKRTF